MTTSYPGTITGSASSAPINNLAVGSKCTATETLPPGFTSHGSACTWRAPQYSPQIVTIVSGVNTLSVTNSYDCGPTTADRGDTGGGVLFTSNEGFLKIEKVVVDNTGGTQLPQGYKFPIWLSCSNFVSGIWLPVPLAAGACSSNDGSCGASTSPPSQAGVTCKVTENVGAALPLGSHPLPSIRSRACDGMAEWTTTYAPSSPGSPYTGEVTIPGNNGTATITVTNTLACVGKTVTNALLIGKEYEHPQGQSEPAGIAFNFVVDCRDPANPSVPHTTNIAITSGGSNAAAISNPPLGWSCTAHETVPSGLDGNGCYWSPGIAVTPNPITIQSQAARNFIHFKNNYICPQVNAAYDLGVTKRPLPDTGGPSKGVVITVQNVGNNAFGATDLAQPNVTVTDYFPAGSVITGYGATDLVNAWNCTPSPAPTAPIPATGVRCIYKGGPLGLFATLPPIQIFVTPGTGAVTYTPPGASTPVTLPPDPSYTTDCVVLSLTTSTGHNDTRLGNNLVCISM